MSLGMVYRERVVGKEERLDRRNTRAKGEVKVADEA